MVYQNLDHPLLEQDRSIQAESQIFAHPEFLSKLPATFEPRSRALAGRCWLLWQ
jgi:hypothetical protein